MPCLNAFDVGPIPKLLRQTCISLQGETGCGKTTQVRPVETVQVEPSIRSRSGAADGVHQPSQRGRQSRQHEHHAASHLQELNSMPDLSVRMLSSQWSSVITCWEGMHRYHNFCTREVHAPQQLSQQRVASAAATLRNKLSASPENMRTECTDHRLDRLAYAGAPIPVRGRLHARQQRSGQSWQSGHHAAQACSSLSSRSACGARDERQAGGSSRLPGQSDSKFR